MKNKVLRNFSFLLAFAALGAVQMHLVRPESDHAHVCTQRDEHVKHQCFVCNALTTDAAFNAPIISPALLSLELPAGSYSAVWSALLLTRDPRGPPTL